MSTAKHILDDLCSVIHAASGAGCVLDIPELQKQGGRLPQIQVPRLLLLLRTTQSSGWLCTCHVMVMLLYMSVLVCTGLQGHINSSVVLVWFQSLALCCTAT